VRFSRLLRTVWLFALAVILGAAFAGLHLLTQEPLPQEWRPVVFAALDHPVATPFLLLFAGAVVLAASLFLAFLLLVLLGAGGAYWALARYLLLD
jgi:hypothetical protein